MSILGPFVMESLNILATLFVVAIGIAALLVVLLLIADVGQTKDAIRRNYHCRIVQSSGRSIPLDELHPAPNPRAAAFAPERA